MRSLFVTILEELGRPRIYLIPSEQFLWVEGDRIRGSCGISSVDYPIITIATNLQGKVRKNTIYHEVAHHLWPWRKHWWIECFAEKMAHGGGRGYWSVKTGHTVDDLPPRSELLKLAVQATIRFNERTKAKRKKQKAQSPA